MTADEREQLSVRDFLGQTPGIFIEVGANHPVGGSQTWHLAQRGWRGIVIEPQQKFYEMLKSGRPEAFVVSAVCTSPEFVGTITLHIPSQDGFATVEPNKDDFDVNYDQTEEVEARTLDSIIAQWREETAAIGDIGFVAVDVEGHELSVLMGFSLAVHRPKLILVEDKLQDLSKHTYFRQCGYKLVRRTCLNNWYIPEDEVAPQRSIIERVKLFRKVFLGLPFRAFRRWRRRKTS
jgi:FkbM family methyltransferase